MFLCTTYTSKYTNFAATPKKSHFTHINGCSVKQSQYCWQGLQWGMLQTHSGWPKSFPYCPCHILSLRMSLPPTGSQQPSQRGTLRLPRNYQRLFKQSTSTASKHQRSGSGEKRVTLWGEIKEIKTYFFTDLQLISVKYKVTDNFMSLWGEKEVCWSHRVMLCLQILYIEPSLILIAWN